MITITPKVPASPEIMEVEYSPHWLKEEAEPSKSTSKPSKSGTDLETAIQELKTAPKHIE